MKDIIQTAAELKAANKPFAMVTVIGVKGSTPRDTGAKMIVLPSGDIIGTIGGASMEYKAIQEAVNSIKDGKIRRVKYLLHDETVIDIQDKEATGMVCGGEMELFIEPFTTSSTLYLFGAGHVAKPTAHIAAMCGFRVEIFDHRPELTTSERFPDAAELHIGDLLQLSQDLQPLENSFAVVVTAGHDTDYAVMRRLLRKPLKYLGVISSRRKKKILFEKLIREGFSQEEIDTIHMPIGLNINSETPEEIAVSIAAELIKIRNM
ncbi:XdhC family protein [bacterium]|nr:XdhC family protein [bacterium]